MAPLIQIGLVVMAFGGAVAILQYLILNNPKRNIVYMTDEEFSDYLMWLQERAAQTSIRKAAQRMGAQSAIARARRRMAA